MRRVGKMPVVEFGDLALLIHLMSAGRLRVFDKRASPKDRPRGCWCGSRTGASCACASSGRSSGPGRSCWPTDAVDDDEAVARSGPEAWPPPPLDEFAALIDQPRHLHPLLRHQARHRRHRPLLGRRDPLGGAPLALQEGLGAERGGGRAATRRPARARRRDRPLRGDDPTSSCPTSADAAAGPQATRASPVRAAARRSRRSSSPSTRPTTARRSRPAAACSRTAASLAC